MAIYKHTTYSFTCDACSEISDLASHNSASVDYVWDHIERERAGHNRGSRWARQQASKDGWSTFSDRDLCPEHSGKRR